MTVKCRENTTFVIHKENPTRCNSVSKFYFIFMWSSTYFGRHTAHHQEPKTTLAASGFAYVERPTTLHVCKTRGCYCSFRLLMMGGVSPKTCWASHKYEIKFWYTLASCWIFFMNYTMIHGSTNIKKKYLRNLNFRSWSCFGAARCLVAVLFLGLLISYILRHTKLIQTPVSPARIISISVGLPHGFGMA